MPSPGNQSRESWQCVVLDAQAARHSQVYQMTGSTGPEEEFERRAIGCDEMTQVT